MMYELPVLWLQSDTLVEDTYAEFRGVRVELRHAPISTLPEDIVAAETSVPISSCTLYVDVHAALCEPPSSCYRALRVGAEPCGVSARLDVCLRRTAATSTATLIITDATSEMHVIPLHVTMGAAIIDARRVLGDEQALFSGTIDTPRQAVRIMVSACSSASTYKACVTVSNTYIFGNIK